MTPERKKMSREDWKLAIGCLFAFIAIGYLTDHYAWARKLGALFDSLWSLFLFIIIALGVIVILARFVSALLRIVRDK